MLPSAGRYGIMLACWHGEPKERPTFPALVKILGDLLQDNSLPVCALQCRRQFQLFAVVFGGYMFWFSNRHIPFRRVRTTSLWTTHRARRMMVSHRLHHGLHLKKNSEWPATLCPPGTRLLKSPGWQYARSHVPLRTTCRFHLLLNVYFRICG